MKAKIRNSSQANGIKFLGYSGDAVDLDDYGFDHPVIYNLQTLQVANQKMPLNYNHRIRIGETTKISNSGQVVRGTGSVTEDNKAAKRVNKSPEKHEASMGLNVENAKVSFHPRKVTVNGQQFVGPHYVIDNSLLDEMTITPEGRDGMTKVHRLSRMELSRIKNAKKKASPPPSRKSKKRVAPAPAPAPTRVQNHDPAIYNRIQKRMIKLRKLENRYPQYAEKIYQMAERDETIKSIYNACRLSAAEDALPNPPRVGGKKKQNDLLEARVLNALCRNPEETLEKKYGAEVRDQVMDMDQIGLKETLVECAARMGGNYNGFSDIDSLTNFIGHYNKQRIENSGFSTFSMPNLFKRVTQFVVEESWKIENFFAPSACMPTSHPDFKTVERIRPSGGKIWEGLDATGRIKHGAFGEEARYLATLDTKAQMLQFNREMIENDDYGAIEEILRLWPEGALIVPDHKLLGHMLAADDEAFWFSSAATVNNTNYKKNSYTGTALTPANLSTLYLQAQKQVISKGRVDWQNWMTDEWDLIVPPELEETAWNIVKQDKLIGNSTSDGQGDKNYWFGKFQIKKFAQLSNTSMNSNAAGTWWFLWPRNTMMAPFAISYLRGRRTPMIMTKEAPVDMLGFVVVGVFDVEINKREPLSIIRAKA